MKLNRDSANFDLATLYTSISTTDMHSPHQESPLALRHGIKPSFRLLQHAYSSGDQCLNTPPTTSLQKKTRGSWFFHIFVATCGNCLKPSVFDKTKPKDANSAHLDISASSSVDDVSSQSSQSSLSFNYAPLSEIPKCITFTMADIIKATRNFSPSLKIGEGGFGTVYKGTLPDGRLVAIKQAKKHAYEMQLSTEFHNEVTALSKVEHLNLVKFIGYLDATPERILVVEYVSNGNLRQHLDGKFGTILDAATRLDVAIDVAHALTYLHHYTDQSIIHRDIKASNVLITENFRAKVADFGFSHLGPWGENVTHVSTQIRGTAGYLDPEYLKSYQLTQKSDVYSFGVLLVEIFTGRSPIQQKKEVKERITTKWAFEKLNEGRAIEALDPKLETSPAAAMMVEKVLELAMYCAAPTKQQRPSMRKTTEILWKVRKDYKNFWRERSRRHSV